MQVSNLDYNSYVGAIAVGRITRGKDLANHRREQAAVETLQLLRPPVFTLLGHLEVAHGRAQPACDGR